MKMLSEVLTELAGRVKRIEDSVAESAEKGQSALQDRRRELESEFDRKKSEFDAAVAQAEEAPRAWLTQARSAIDEQVSAMRAGFEQWQSDLEAKNAVRAAESAEQDAVAALSLADYVLGAAEWAAVQARLARAEADDLADKDQ